ncbi:chromosome transmission fidelity protein 8 [Emericellopsis cladophorae]|uniref:Chromosome transmission fidelity protein 8 n=1 Tax=Emericellopsis cladophorae TaxID=2686198 RepID=A0A9Q0BEP4_9HYPO|nr:chromosome transmission fidelity protein 8 [Emericellopsis cladophorae]KAI6781820.1 chromosome transmission fidelity protein 8 [Emericellopsis cladophorae]
MHPPDTKASTASPLPTLLKTPGGLALLDLQGTINHPKQPNGEPLIGDFSFGRLEFPEYDPDSVIGGTAWMKRVFLYVGEYQRLNGEVKKLVKPFAIVGKKQQQQQQQEAARGEGEGKEDELEIIDIVKYKLLFSGRPEPVGTEHAPV